jgi:hypothetical protein
MCSRGHAAHSATGSRGQHDAETRNPMETFLPGVADAIAQSRAAGAGGSVFPKAAGSRGPLEGDR